MIFVWDNTYHKIVSEYIILFKKDYFDYSLNNCNTSFGFHSTTNEMKI